MENNYHLSINNNIPNEGLYPITQGIKRIREKTLESLELPAIIEFLDSSVLHFIALTSHAFKQYVEGEFQKRISNAALKIISINDTTLTNSQIFKICDFVERFFQDYIENGQSYLCSEDSELPCDLDYDPQTKLRFIHTDDHIGEGGYKVVTKSILYDPIKPQNVASLQSERQGKNGKILEREISMHYKLKHIDRALRLIAIPPPESEWVQRVITKFYPLGTLRENVDRLSFKDKVCVARDILEAIKEMHTLDIVHGDLHETNILIEINEDPQFEGISYRAVLIDFGMTVFAKSKNFFKADLENISAIISPEILNYSFSDIDTTSGLPLTPEEELVSISYSMQSSILPAAYWYERVNVLLKSMM